MLDRQPVHSLRRKSENPSLQIEPCAPLLAGEFSSTGDTNAVMRSRALARKVREWLEKHGWVPCAPEQDCVLYGR